MSLAAASMDCARTNRRSSRITRDARPNEPSQPAHEKLRNEPTSVGRDRHYRTNPSTLAAMKLHERFHVHLIKQRLDMGDLPTGPASTSGMDDLRHEVPMTRHGPSPARQASSTTTRSFASTGLAACTSTSFTTPSLGACSAVAIFIASIGSSTSPAFTVCPRAPRWPKSSFVSGPRRGRRCRPGPCGALSVGPPRGWGRGRCATER